MTDTVAIVLDPEFGDNLGALARRMHVWIVRSPTNVDAAALLRNASVDVTTFQATNPDDRQKNLLDILTTVDLHHGPYSSSSPYRSLLVIGLERTSALTASLLAEGFGNARDVTNGFSIDLIGPYLNRD